LQGLRSHLGRSRRRGGADIGDKIGDGEIGLMAHAADDGHGAGGEGVRQLFVVEGPQVLDGATAAHQQNHVYRLRGLRIVQSGSGV
jgi:hypothetical protein